MSDATRIKRFSKETVLLQSRLIPCIVKRLKKSIGKQRSPEANNPKRLSRSWILYEEWRVQLWKGAVTDKTRKPGGFSLNNPFANIRTKCESRPVAEPVKHLKVLVLKLVDMVS